MNSDLNSAQHSTLSLAHLHVLWHAPCAVTGTLTIPSPKPCRDTWNSIVTWGRANSVATEKSLSRQKALRDFSRQRFPCHDRKHYKACRNREFSITTELFYHTGLRSLSRTRGTNCARSYAHVALAGLAGGSRQKKLSQHQPRVLSQHKMSVPTHGRTTHIARTHVGLSYTLLRALVHGVAPPCSDTKNTILTQGPRTLSRQNFSVATEDSKRVVAHSGLLHFQFPFFFSFYFPFQSTLNST